MGHIHVQAYEQAQALVTEETPFETSPSLEKIIKTEKGVTHIQPFATKSAILKKGENFAGIILKGINNQFDWQHFQSFLQQGKHIDFGDTLYSKQVIISAGVAKSLQFDYWRYGTGLFSPAAKRHSISKSCYIGHLPKWY